MELLPAYQEMINVHGWAGTAATLGMSKSALEARVYEVKGSGMRVSTALLIQRYAGTTHFAQAVAAASGGVYVDLPEGDCADGDVLHEKFQELYIRLGELSGVFRESIKDDEIDKGERCKLQGISQQMHKTMQELMTLMFRVYCRIEPGSTDFDTR